MVEALVLVVMAAVFIGLARWMLRVHRASGPAVEGKLTMKGT
jgi:hypothetical protein